MSHIIIFILTLFIILYFVGFKNKYPRPFYKNCMTGVCSTVPTHDPLCLKLEYIPYSEGIQNIRFLKSKNENSISLLPSDNITKKKIILIFVY